MSLRRRRANRPFPASHSRTMTTANFESLNDYPVDERLGFRRYGRAELLYWEAPGDRGEFQL